MLGDRGIKPDELPPEDDLKKLDRRVQSAEKEIIRDSKLPDMLDDGVVED